MDNAVIVRAALSLIPLGLSLTVHEFAHALVARRLGDCTAQEQGRLTLNPVSHIDPIGTLLVPMVQATTGIPFIGWAKPVPVDPSRFRRDVDRRRGMAMVSVAGPLANLLLACIGAALVVFGGAWFRSLPILREIAQMFMVMNVGLFLFNLLPIAPLDGSKLLPGFFDPIQRRIAPFSMFILMGIFLVPAISNVIIGQPMRFIVQGLLAFFGAPMAWRS